MSNDGRSIAALCHALTLTGLMIPFANIIAPLVLWIVKREEFPLVDDQGREALNFQISVTIYAAIGGILTFVLIGIPLLVALGIFDIVVTIMAAVRASNGERYRYPLTLRLLK